MYVAIGDPHFTDETIRKESVPSHFLLGFLEELETTVKRVKPKKIKFCLPGDFLDVIASARWNYEIKDGEYRYSKKLVRPWDNNTKGVLNKTRVILQQILGTRDLLVFLEKFKEFSRRMAVPIEVYYIPRNHDYLVGAFPELRKMVAEAFGLIENQNFFFRDIIYDEKIGLYISHGNEYDIYSIPKNDKNVTFGDAMMIEFLNRLAIESFLKIKNAEVSRKLAEIQEVRPQRAAVGFIQEIAKEAGIKESALEKLLLDIFDDFFKQKFITDWLTDHQLEINLKPRAFFLYRIFIPFLKILRPLRRMKKTGKIDSILSNIYKAFHLEMKEDFNSVIKNRLADLSKDKKIKYFVFGHSHDFERSSVNHDSAYNNLGTWLRQYHRTGSGFEAVRKLTYALFFEEGEKAEREFDIKQTIIPEDF